MFKRNQFGAELGGPVRTDKTFFFLAWQGTIVRGTPTTSTAPITSATFGQITSTQTAPRVGELGLKLLF